MKILNQNQKLILILGCKNNSLKMKKITIFIYIIAINLKSILMILRFTAINLC